MSAVVAARPPGWPDIEDLERQLDSAERDSTALVAGLTAEQGIWRARPGSWGISECLDHLAAANRVYLQPMGEAAARARAGGQHRRGPARPGWAGRWFVRSFEPPPIRWLMPRAPRTIRPRPAPPLAEAVADFRASQAEVRAFLLENADLDLAGVRFVNPFVWGVRWSLATGLHVITAHERRHLWQAWGVRRALERHTRR